MRNRPLAIFGSFGHGNAGDEAVPLAITDLAEASRIKVTTSVVSRFADVRMPQVISWNSIGLDKVAPQADTLVLLSGGGIVEPSSMASVFRVRKLLRELNPTALELFGVSVESGVSYGFARKLNLWNVLRRTHTIYTRDLLSKRELLNLLPIAPKRVKVIGDVVLWLEGRSTSIGERVTPSRKYVSCLLTPRWEGNEKWEDWIVSELANVARLLDCTLLFLPMSTLADDDRSQHARIGLKISRRYPSIECLEVREHLSPREVMYLISRSELSISMRLHGCVMAYSSRVPFVSISYHPKVLGFLETVDRLASSVPTVLPSTQSHSSYGYSFSDLKFENGELVGAASKVLKNDNYAMLDDLKERAASAFLDIVAR